MSPPRKNTELILPDGTVLAAGHCAEARNTYLLGLFLHAEELYSYKRNHRAYMALYEDYYDSLSVLRKTFATQYPASLQAHLASLCNPTPPPRDRTELHTLASLHAGYLADQVQQATQQGLTEADSIWAYLMLKEHPPRLGGMSYYAKEKLACPYPRPARLPHIPRREKNLPFNLG